MIKAENISKTFILPHERRFHLRDYFVNMFRPMTYERQRVLEDISFSVKDGEWLGVIGGNGAGKSTLLKILSGIYVPDKGRVIHHGKIIPFLELGVGFQPEMSARDNIFLNGLLLGMTKSNLIKTFDEIVDYAELRPSIDQKLKNFSNGMRLRLGFAVAIHAPANIFLLDEVLAVGDYMFQQKSLNTLKNKLRNKTVVFVSHDLEKIKNHCHRVMWLEHGSVKRIGDPIEVVEEYIRSQTI